MSRKHYKRAKTSGTETLANERLTASRVRRSLQTRYNPIANLKPATLTQWLDLFHQGYLGEAARLWDAIERRDDKIAACKRKRVSAIARFGFEILTIDTGEDEPLAATAEEHKAALEYFYNNLTATNALDENQRGGFSLLARQMADAIGKKYAVHEIVWQPGSGQDDGGLTAEFRCAPLWFFENRTGRLRFLENDGSFEGVEMDRDEWLVSVHDGIMEACSVAYMFKRLPMQDWLSYTEKFGMPGVHAETSAAYGSSEWNAVVDAVGAFMNDWGAVTSQGTKFNLLEASGGTTPFEALIERMDRAITILWRGADLSTMSAGQGSGQGASVQEDESALLEQDDAAWLEETLAMQISRQVIAYHFGQGVKPLAYLKLKNRDERDMKLDMDLLKMAAELGIPVAIKDARERLGLPTPEEGETMISRPAAAPMSPMALLGNQRQPERQNAAVEQYLQTARKTIAAATSKDLRTLREAIAGVLETGDVDFVAKVRALQAKLPAMAPQILDAKQSTAAMEQVLSSALLTGLTERTQES